MAKSSKKRKGGAQPAQQTRKQIALGRKEARQNRIILLSVGAVALLVVLILGIGLVNETIIKPTKAVAIVNGSKIPTNEYQPLVNHRRYGMYFNINQLRGGLSALDPADETSEFLRDFYEQQLQQFQMSLDLIADSVLEEMIEDELIREKADEAGLQVTDDEIEQTITASLQPAQTSQETITDTEQLPTATPIPQDELDEKYKKRLKDMQLSDKEYRAIVKRGLYRTKVQELLASQVPTMGLVVRVQLIQTNTEDEALAAQERIEGGEDFALVAQEVSTDTLSAENGGNLGWVATGQLSSQYGQEVEDLVFSLEVGAMDLVQSNDNWYVIKVQDRDENGPLPDEVVIFQQNNALVDWLSERKASPDVVIERLLTEDQIPPDPFAALLGY
jgi:parvulin-like peptidyl-prolyl isomerase